MYHRQPSHLAPEASRFNLQGGQGQDMRLGARHRGLEAARILQGLDPGEKSFVVWFSQNETIGGLILQVLVPMCPLADRATPCGIPFFFEPEPSVVS